MLSARAAATAAAVVLVLLALGRTITAFVVVAAVAVTVVSRLRRVEADEAGERSPVDLDKAISTVERIARLGATRRRPKRGKR